MFIRRDDISGKRTPDGILTRIAKTAVGSILREIEARSDPATIDLGFMLLTLSEDAIVKINKAIQMTATKARKDGESHDVSFPLSEAGAGSQCAATTNRSPLPPN